MSTERASNLSMIGAVKMVRAPHTRKVTPLSMAISLSDRLKSCSMTSSAAGMTPVSKLMKKLAARSERRITYRVPRGTSVRSLISFRSIEEPTALPS